MDVGFFHPQRGYWQASGSALAKFRGAYPEGTIEVPLKPGANFEWVSGAWRELAAVPGPVPQELTFAQLLIGLVTAGWITENEGDNWLDGQLPVAVIQVIAALPQAQRFAARARAKRPSVVLRNDPLLNALAAAQNKSQAELDDFFRAYSGA